MRVLCVEDVADAEAAVLAVASAAAGSRFVRAAEAAKPGGSRRPALLAGTSAQYDLLVARLKEHSAEAAVLADHIDRTLRAFEGVASVPWVCRSKRIAIDSHTVIMGIVNLTEDSFSGDGLGGQVDAAVQRGLEFLKAGAEILDLGAESTRPGSLPVPADQEIARLAPVVRELVAATDVPISVDTQKPEVARVALELGASIVNDISGLRSPGMIETVAEYGAGAVIMHMLGEPRTMQVAPHYDNLMGKVFSFLTERLEAAVEAGIEEEALAVDPGFGFGKTVNHNLEILRRLRELHSLGRPVVLGTSRKSTIGKVLGRPPEERLMGTAATCALGIANGAHVLRVHDVPEMVQVAAMTDAVLRGWDQE